MSAGPACFHGDLIYSIEGAIGFMVAACATSKPPCGYAAYRSSRFAADSTKLRVRRPTGAYGDVNPKGIYSDPASWTLEEARGQT
jgi:hypothetical protein